MNQRKFIRSSVEKSPGRKMKCQYCGKNVPWWLKDFHEAFCSARTKKPEITYKLGVPFRSLTGEDEIKALQEAIDRMRFCIVIKGGIYLFTDRCIVEDGLVKAFPKIMVVESTTGERNVYKPTIEGEPDDYQISLDSVVRIESNKCFRKDVEEWIREKETRLELRKGAVGRWK